jgi:pimeloyl-ACP methyl ester carboxylesterase
MYVSSSSFFGDPIRLHRTIFVCYRNGRYRRTRTMNLPDMTAAPHEDVWIAHPRGRIFARIWSGAAAGIRADKAPIVLVHDSLGCVDLWRNFPAKLGAATGRAVIAYDRLGFGRSAPRQDKLPQDFVADEAATFFPLIRERLGLRNFVAFGHSVGGGMAVHCAARYPEDCRALITVAAQAFVGDETRHGILAAKEAFQHAGHFERLRKYHGEKARWVLDAWTETWLDPGFASWSLADVLPMVKCPVLAIHGAQDEYGSARHPETIAARSGGPSRIVMMADTGHLPHRERPGELVALAAGFLARAD